MKKLLSFAVLSVLTSFTYADCPPGCYNIHYGVDNNAIPSGNWSYSGNNAAVCGSKTDGGDIQADNDFSSGSGKDRCVASGTIAAMKEADNNTACTTTITDADVSLYLKSGSCIVGNPDYSMFYTGLPVGTILQGLWAENNVPVGWIPYEEGTIGASGSAATILASNTTKSLFIQLWNAFPNLPVSGGRGASAQADFAAKKTIALPSANGRVLGIAGDGTGLTDRNVGDSVGEETHQLTIAEMPSHTHQLSNPYFIQGVNNSSQTVATGGSGWHFDSLVTVLPAGGDQPHNNIQPTLFVAAIIKL